jgi:hypothetical protein
MVLMPWVLFLVACGGVPAAEQRYLDDRDFRREELVASLVNPSNGYSALRLQRYATDQGGWDALDEWNPRVEPAELGRTIAAPLAAGAALDLDVSLDDQAALRALGETAFFRYPVQLSADLGPALASSEAAARYGLWFDGERGVGGIVRVELAAGIGLAYTCSTCHASSRQGSLVVGLGNERLDFGRLFLDDGTTRPPDVAAAFAAWGPGRLDVTTPTGVEPVRLPDLRAVRELTHLQADATVQQRDLITLAIRLETLIITSHGESVRPPRIVSLALAAYLWSLADALPVPPATTAPGAAVFAENCASCHTPPTCTGMPVALDVVGTDPTLGESRERGTGSYRVPSLRGVSSRGLFFHDGAISSLTALLDPARISSDYTGGVRPGPVPGHLFGLELDGASRTELLSFLNDL